MRLFYIRMVIHCTLEAIKKMKGINIYIIGSTKTVSKAVENYLSNLDNVKNLERIDGETPYDIAVNFAKYKDPKTEFGWNRNYRDGHAFTFGNSRSNLGHLKTCLGLHLCMDSFWEPSKMLVMKHR